VTKITTKYQFILATNLILIAKSLYLHAFQHTYLQVIFVRFHHSFRYDFPHPQINYYLNNMLTNV